MVFLVSLVPTVLMLAANINAMPTSEALEARAPSLDLDYYTWQTNCNPTDQAGHADKGHLDFGTNSCQYFPGVGEVQIRQANSLKITGASGMGSACYLELYPQTGCGGTRMGRIGPIGNMGAGSCIAPADGSTGQLKPAKSAILKC